MGRLLENTVYLELIKHGKSIAYSIQDQTECDFVIKGNTTIQEAIQVAVHLDDPSTKNREIRGLINTCKRYHLNKGTILCMDRDEEFIENDIFIQVISAWRYLINLSST
jgi:predicted AAA+ superfamily ATPase